jgi:hypothetical protein
MDRLLEAIFSPKLGLLVLVTVLAYLLSGGCADIKWRRG